MNSNSMNANSRYPLFHTSKYRRLRYCVVISHQQAFGRSVVLHCSNENRDIESHNKLFQNAFWFHLRGNRKRIIIFGIIASITIGTICIFSIRSVNFGKSIVSYIKTNDIIHSKSNQSVLTTGTNLFFLLNSFLWLCCVSSFLVSLFKQYRSISHKQQKLKTHFYKNNFLSFRNFAFVLFLLYIACIVFLALAGIAVPSALGPFYFKLAELFISAVIIAPGLTSISVIMSSGPMFTKLLYDKKPIVITTVSRENGLLYYLALLPPKLVSNKHVIHGVIGIRSSSDSIAYIGTVEYFFSKNLTLYNYFFQKSFWYFLWHLMYAELAVKIQNVLYFLPYMPVVQVEEPRHLESYLADVFVFKIRECDPNCCFPEKLIDDTVIKLGLSIDDVITAFSWIRLYFVFCTNTWGKDFETYKLKNFEIRETDRKPKVSYKEYKESKRH